MGNNTEKKEVPEAILEAYDLLLQYRLVNILRPLQWESYFVKEGWTFHCEFSVAYPNLAGIPSNVIMKFLLQESFPLSCVEVYSLSKEVAGFPHQELLTDKLCLKNDWYAPRTSQKLIKYVQWTIEWLKDAASNNLIDDQDPYELPDFYSLTVYSAYRHINPVFFNESPSTFNLWKKQIGKFGTVYIVSSKLHSAFYACQFCNQENIPIIESKYSPIIDESDYKLTGYWILVEDIVFKRHRPPLTYGEAKEICEKSALDFYSILRKAWECNTNYTFGIILIGFPIPRTYRGENVEIHWQPLWIDNWASTKKINIPGKRSKKNNVWRFLIKSDRFHPSKNLPWGESENVSNDRLFKRSSLSLTLKHSKITVIGCGALGSPIVDMLARGGIEAINTFDSDTLHPGNLSRHILNGTFIGSNKALAIAKELSITFPLSSIKGFPEHIPPSTFEKQKAINKILVESDIFIDCTTSESAFIWLNNIALEHGKKLISMFFNAYAEVLTLCISGGQISCLDIYRELCLSIQKNELPVDKEYYFKDIAKEEQIYEGVGCWHSTFPALNVHIQLLAATAVDLINHVIQNRGNKGYAALIQRESFEGMAVTPHSVVKLIWEKEYP